MIHRQILSVKTINGKIEEGQLRWYGHVKRVEEGQCVQSNQESERSKKSFFFSCDKKRSQDRPK